MIVFTPYSDESNGVFTISCTIDNFMSRDKRACSPDLTARFGKHQFKWSIGVYPFGIPEVESTEYVSVYIFTGCDKVNDVKGYLNVRILDEKNEVSYQEPDSEGVDGFNLKKIIDFGQFETGENTGFAQFIKRDELRKKGLLVCGKLNLQVRLKLRLNELPDTTSLSQPVGSEQAPTTQAKTRTPTPSIPNKRAAAIVSKGNKLTKSSRKSGRETRPRK